ncbi:hypothetical protein IF655_25750 [Streptomyces sp. DSM 110735]|uniref:hypothetical protein n=1 Tax=Streptomyces sp. DSM 110735 TaxID=2775031 RepID=UPI0018F5F327|nr:hypothetical protein [Streptomyces sp. DSM 110735]MBJ7906698.1 hypothetical protein [Streptomyces sp. DSM 110735]
MSDAKKSDKVTPQESHITGGETADAAEATPQESHITGGENAAELDDVTTLESHITTGDPR